MPHLPFNPNTEPEKVILVSVAVPGQSDLQVREYLDELEFLAHTAGAVTLKKFVQKLQHPDSRTYVGKGKLAEILEFVKENKVQIIIFDDELSPSQIRNIEKEAKIRILDRTNLILDIFAKRARTAQARTQVELAQYQYLLPRLTRMWTHLEKQRGGIGLRGPGESEIETDRRVIRDKLSRLKEKLREIDKQNLTRRKQREKLVRVALVGYTNVGKSTLMNILSKSTVFAENKLFATLDTTVRKVVWDGIPFLLSDTVGFIRKLPHNLVESFKSTLDEVREADILVHVVDISHPGFEEQIAVVNQTLVDIGDADKPVLLVFNKTDAYSMMNEEGEPSHPTLDEIKNLWIAKENLSAVFISAAKNINIAELREKLMKLVKVRHYQIYPNTPQTDYFQLPPGDEEAE
jgi:GTPase